MVKAHSHSPQFEVIDLIADADDSTMTVLFYDEYVEKFETTLKTVNASVKVEATLNVEFENSAVDEDGHVGIDVTKSEILESAVTVRILEQVDDFEYEEIQAEIADIVLEDLRKHRFLASIDYDE